MIKFSICIPHFNRFEYLKKSLKTLELQSYPELEIIVGDDCSSDETKLGIQDIQLTFRHKLVYHRFESNQGYDRNFRKSIELASGHYAIVIGNDDTINPDFSLLKLADFIENNGFPELGFSNFLEDEIKRKFVQRAAATAILGSGYGVAMNYYSCFSFVGGTIWKKESFDRFNSESQDGSIYSQIYLAVLMISRGCRLFSIKEPMVIKDLVLENQKERNSYLQTIARKWTDYKPLNGGLHSVIHVLIEGLRAAGVLNQARTYLVFRRIYTLTYPYWLLDYRTHGAFPAAVGLMQGMVPHRSPDIGLLNGMQTIRLWVWYSLASLAGLVTPLFIFTRTKSLLYKMVKRR
ncbi:MAG TPA: glycosyltransferase family 2 protein [Saprospiraceae bacterium]|nr:glycosyltransferase family 2 protein [Saprospiraceae bacterium]HNT19449.1 glycosyltransferase family 2 protein [Saprospiraceae bacterium]